MSRPGGLGPSRGNRVEEVGNLWDPATNYTKAVVTEPPESRRLAAERRAAASRKFRETRAQALQRRKVEVIDIRRLLMLGDLDGYVPGSRQVVRANGRSTPSTR